MGGFGNFIGAAWFFMLFLAAITSSLSMYQPAVALLKESLGWSHGKATAGIATLGTIGAILTLWFTQGGAFWSTVDFWVGTFLIFIMAGVPSITASMLQALSGTLEGGRPMVSVTVGAFAAESVVADMLRETEAAFEGVSIGSYPFDQEGRYGSNFVIRSVDEELAERCAEAVAVGLRRAGYEPVAGGI